MYPSLSERSHSPGPKKILCCDGLDAMSPLALPILSHLEAELTATCANGTDFVLADYFDLVCGTGSGALLAACIASGMSMAHINQLSHAIAHSRLHDHQRLGAQLQAAFDAQLVESNPTLGSPKLRSLLTLVLRDAHTHQPWPVCNHPENRYNDLSRRDCHRYLPLWQLVRASVAASSIDVAPEVVTYAAHSPEAYEFFFADGTLTPYQNPALLALQMATLNTYGLNWACGADQLLIVSVGVNLLESPMPIQPLPAVWLQTCNQSIDMACRMLADCRYVDRWRDNLDDSLAGNATIANAFSYIRYAPEIPIGQPASKLTEIGQAYARRAIDPQHFQGFL